ncbi:hypothetical protein IQ265_13755 [Nodosilinea sp. LEGE 06152]|uniref:hypothetical protein n=1 Tax=Nodosilinea sp. LEGE 06152 TaxID=2777966 RepID=UPI001880FF19|nr:hypothetical protein [Nodosilinea sp. LEGE 06152]MBE9157881.1 hypothetical protein [Nodosilinea sp. LEGE 06152]
MSTNKGGRAMLLHSGHNDDRPKRLTSQPIALVTKARMVAILKDRGKLASIYLNDRSLIALMRDSRRARQSCDECNGTGVDTSRRNPEPCPVCNGKRYR